MRPVSWALAALVLGIMTTTGSCQISRQECEDQGGQVVGDIGNGAIFQPDYVCEVDGNPPTDVIVPGVDEPIAIEGEVCCGGPGDGIGDQSGGSGGGLPMDPNAGGDGLTGAEDGIVATEDDGSRPEMSVDDCAAMGGLLIYDVGDGAIHRDDYVCELSGLPPLGTVIARAGEPMPREGQVCCPSSGETDPEDGVLLPGNNATERDDYTRQECLDMNGTIVGDIGDGDIFDEDYICKSDSLPPLANIIENEAPFAIEGEVCCGAGLPVMDTNRDEVTRQECEAQGGLIVGDIGDGATQADDYTCESNGMPPIANVVPAEGEPIAFEGEVCCRVGLPVTETNRDEVTRQECEEQGGEIVGDIGDGATQADDYMCESNGMPPVANVVPAEGEPISFEGEVCCGSNSSGSSTTDLLEGSKDGASLLSVTSFLGTLLTLCMVNFM